MEPVTHILTGACLARTGLNRRTAYATLAMAVGAEFPDIDTLWGLRGPVAAFQHHRGITHTFMGLPVEAALVVGGVYLLHRWRVHRRTHVRSRDVDRGHGHVAVAHPLIAAPVRWGLLYGFTLLALLSHLMLDYTNNYGLRPFFPFNPGWYAGSFTFIFDPLMFAMLLSALILPSLFRLISSEVGARREPFAPRGWAVVALLGVATLWTVRAIEHSRAVALAMAQSYAFVRTPPQPIDTGGNVQPPAVEAVPSSVVPVFLEPQRVLASPGPVNPFRWYTVADFGPLYQMATVDLRTGASVPSAAPAYKLQTSPELLAAFASPLGRAYLDWSPMPFLSVTHPTDAGAGGPFPAPAVSIVTFEDPRFLGDLPWLHLGGKGAPLTGSVLLDAGDHVLVQTMDGRVQPR